MTKYFKKIQKILFWGYGVILVFFTQIWEKLNFPGKKALSVFKYSNYIPSCQISEKTISMSEENAELTDGLPDRGKDGQTTTIL